MEIKGGTLTLSGVIAWEGRAMGELEGTWSREAVAALASETVKVEEREGKLVAVATFAVGQVEAADLVISARPVGCSVRGLR